MPTNQTGASHRPKPKNWLVYVWRGMSARRYYSTTKFASLLLVEPCSEHKNKIARTTKLTALDFDSSSDLLPLREHATLINRIKYRLHHLRRKIFCDNSLVFGPIMAEAKNLEILTLTVHRIVVAMIQRQSMLTTAVGHCATEISFFVHRPNHLRAVGR